MAEVDPEELARLVDLITGSLNALAVAVTNETAAAMNEGEEALIKPSLSATLKNAAPALLVKVQTYSGPAGLLTGLALWGVRLSQLKPSPAKPVMSVGPTSQPTPPPLPRKPGDGLGSVPATSIGGNL